MGWFWDSKAGGNGNGDAYKNLDSGLKDFLDQESSSQRASQKPIAEPKTAPRSEDGASTTYRAQIGINDGESATRHDSPSGNTDEATVPRESLFQDGRYAHLWRTYRSQASVDASGKTDQDKLSDVVDAYKDRKAAIGRAALENCVMEQMAEKECYSHGGVKKLMGMCRAENREFNRCYVMQSKFLKALGYLSSQSSTADEEERIQMHADKLYHEMLAREKAMEEAEKAGRQAPVFEPLLQQDKIVQALGTTSAYARARQKAQDASLSTNLSAYAPEKQDEIQQRLKGLNEHEKQIELQLIAAESRSQMEFADRVGQHMEEERQHRAERRERGHETVGDTIKRWWGWRQ